MSDNRSDQYDAYGPMQAAPQPTDYEVIQDAKDGNGQVYKRLQDLRNQFNSSESARKNEWFLAEKLQRENKELKNENIALHNNINSLREEIRNLQNHGPQLSNIRCILTDTIQKLEKF